MLLVPSTVKGSTGIVAWALQARLDPGRMANVLKLRLPTATQAAFLEIKGQISIVGDAEDGNGQTFTVVGAVTQPNVALMDFIGNPAKQVSLQAWVKAHFPDPGGFTIDYELASLSPLPPYQALPPEVAQTQVTVTPGIPGLAVAGILGVAGALVVATSRGRRR